MPSTEIADNVAVVRGRIARAAVRGGRAPGDVTLIAVTKMQPVERVLSALEAGVTDFGENRVQEALSKFAASGARDVGLVSRESLRLHLIGGLQRNKARQAARHFDCVQTVDRIELLADLDGAAARERGGLALPVLVEVNVTGEASKGGVAPGELPRLAEALAACIHLRGVGLMTVARLGAGEGELRATFSGLRRLLEDLQGSSPGEWRHLSMGMSDDFELAIEEGATMVRVGRALFGERARAG